MEYQSKTDIVTVNLRKLIQTGELGPGAVLRQRELAERFGVSPTPIREALRRLEAEGYVLTELHREATVVPAGNGQVRETLFIMASLESLGASLAAEKITDTDIAELETIHAELDEIGEDVPALIELNRRFHFRIYETARSPILISLLNLLWRSATAQLPAMLPTPATMADEHRALLDALKNRDTAKAASLTCEHILTTAANLLGRGDVSALPDGVLTSVAGIEDAS